MATEITMPKLSDTMEEGTILEWRVSQGDRVHRGDIIAEVETDKAAMEMEAFDGGVVGSLKVEEGQTVSVGTVIAVLDGEEKEKTEKIEEKEESAHPRKERQATAVEEDEDVRVTVTPAARKLADEQNVELRSVEGSGPGGRIVLDDVKKAMEKGEGGEVFREKREKARQESKKSIRIRRIIARKMVEAWESIPHFYVTVAVDMTDVIRFRKDLGVTINDFVITAAARSLEQHPWVNSWWVDGEAKEQERVNIAMAVATEGGLYNPVIRDCGGLSLKGIHQSATELADLAHGGNLTSEMMADGTFTISNMGMMGVESFSAIVTPPQVAVLAVGTVKGEVVVDENGEPGIAPIVRLTLSADHRVLDGADAAEFLDSMKTFLEAPVTLIAGDK